MARLDQLNLNPANEHRPTRQAPSTDDLHRIENFLANAEDLLDQEERYRFAWDTISGMRDSVKSGQVPTQKMEQALENIRQGGRRHEQSAKNWGRRYEGM